MKATNLMLGDWVTFADALKAGEFYPIKITSLTLPDRIAGYHPHPAIEGSDVYGEDDLAGIPLTPEILEKNFRGYKRGSGALTYFIYEINEEYFIYASAGSIDLYTHYDDSEHAAHDDIYLVELRYVHLLQHALRLCGIEKEIKL